MSDSFNIWNSDGYLIPYTKLVFSGGEVQVRVGTERPLGNVRIHANIFSSENVMELILLVDAIRRVEPGVKISLCCPYLPYARQDRVCAPGESLSVKVMADILNSLHFESVEIWDAHSDVSVALIDRVENVHQKVFVERVQWSNTVLVAPDAGAIKKTLGVAKATNLPMVRADKVRSVDDGSITGTVVYSDHIGAKDFLIVDDICDGGRTFIELAKVLRPLTDGKIYLYVTHGIFSKGLDVFKGIIDGVYTANPFPRVDLSDPILTVL